MPRATFLPRALLAMVILLLSARARPWYQERIPNGDGVRWHAGVGHVNPGGGGERNQFGKDFEDVGHQWTKELCMMDSDGDGFSNGQELGDPDCEWSFGQTPKFTAGIRHPGVPEGNYAQRPYDSCATFQDAESSSVEDLTFSNYRLPLEQKTTYACQKFQIPSDKPLWVTRFDPLIQSPEVVHHILIYVCADEPTSRYLSSSEPRQCYGMSGECDSILFAWAVGTDSFCLPQDMGVSIEGRTWAVMEIHYDNARNLDVTDSSGIRLTLVDSVPLHEAGIMLVGETGFSKTFYGLDFSGLRVPPGESDFHYHNECPSGCLEHHMAEGSEPLTVIATAAHAHKIGVAVRADRVPSKGNESAAEVLMDEPYYDFDLQRFTLFQPSDYKQLHRGDRIRVDCRYDSTGRSWVTYSGEESNQEMCLFVFMYYPRIRDLSACVGRFARTRHGGEPTFASCGWATSDRYAEESSKDLLLVDAYNGGTFFLEGYWGSIPAINGCNANDIGALFILMNTVLTAGQQCDKVADGTSDCATAACVDAMNAVLVEPCVAAYGTYTLLSDQVLEFLESDVPPSLQNFFNDFKQSASTFLSASARCGVCTDHRECPGNSRCECMAPMSVSQATLDCRCNAIHLTKIDHLEGAWIRHCDDWSEERYDFEATGNFSHVLSVFDDEECGELAYNITTIGTHERSPYSGDSSKRVFSIRLRMNYASRRKTHSQADVVLNLTRVSAVCASWSWCCRRQPDGTCDCEERLLPPDICDGWCDCADGSDESASICGLRQISRLCPDGGPPLLDVEDVQEFVIVVDSINGCSMHALRQRRVAGTELGPRFEREQGTCTDLDWQILEPTATESTPEPTFATKCTAKNSGVNIDVTICRTICDDIAAGCHESCGNKCFDCACNDGLTIPPMATCSGKIWSEKKCRNNCANTEKCHAKCDDSCGSDCSCNVICSGKKCRKTKKKRRTMKRKSKNGGRKTKKRKGA